MLPEPRGGGAGKEGAVFVFSDGGAGARWVMWRGVGGTGFRVFDALRALEDERGGTLPWGMLNILEKLLSSGLFGDGVLLVVLPRFADLRPYRSVS